MEIAPVTLTGSVVRLEPLSEQHAPDLTVAAHDERIWRYMLYAYPEDEEKMLAWVRDILARQAAGADLAFAVIHLASGRAIGATRYLEIRPEHRSLEIGGTWYATGFQRTAVNTECKYLMLKHAFEVLGCIRVQFKADARNLRSLLTGYRAPGRGARGRAAQSLHFARWVLPGFCLLQHTGQRVAESQRAIGRNAEVT